MTIPTGGLLARRLAVLPFWIAGAILTLHLGVHALEYLLGFGDRQPWRFLLFQFNLDREGNFATWTATLLLAAAGVLLLTIALARLAERMPWAFCWAALGGGFLLLSLDEMASYHERVSEALRDRLALDGILTNAWVLPAIPLVALVLVVLIPFLRSLPSATRRGLLLSGTVFLTGAVGVEVFSGLIRDLYGFHDPRMMLITTLEEALELFGVAMLIHTLVHYMVATRSVMVLAADRPHPAGMTST